MPVFLSSDEAYQRWRTTNVRPQKQFGYVMATATVPLGDLTSEQMRVLGELARAYGDGTVRVTPDQNLVFRWVSVGDLRELYRRLAAAEANVAAFRFGAMNDADTDIVFAIDANHADLLIAHRRRGSLLCRRKNFGVGDIHGRATRQMLGRRCRLHEMGAHRR